METRLLIALFCIFGHDFIESSAATIKHDCQGYISTSQDVLTKLLNRSDSCNILFRAKGKNQLLRASFDDFDPGQLSYAIYTKVYDSENERNETKILLDLKNAGTAKTVIFSRGPAILLWISRSLHSSFSLEVTTFMKDLVVKKTSAYRGNITSPRYLITAEPKTYEMVKNLRFIYTITPRFESSVSLKIPELSTIYDCLQLFHLGQTVCKMNNSVNYNMTSDELQILMDSNKTASPRGEGFSLTYEACGGESSDVQANIFLPTPTFFGFDKQLKCSYVYSNSKGNVPVLTLRTKMKTTGSQNNGIFVKICIGNGCFTPSGDHSLDNFSESYLGNSTEIAVLLSYNSKPALMHPVVFANFSSRRKDCSVHHQERSGSFSSETYGGKYPNNLLCNYIIKGSPTSSIWLKFMMVDLAQENDCGDYIEIREDGNVTTLCNSTTLTYTSSSNEVQIVFRTDEKDTAKGFTVEWEIFSGQQEEIDAVSGLPSAVPVGVATLCAVVIIGALSCIYIRKYNNRPKKTRIEPTVTHNPSKGEAQINERRAHDGQVYAEKDNGVYDCAWDRRKILQEQDIEYAKANHNDTEYGSDIPDSGKQTQPDNTEGQYEFAGNSKGPPKDEDKLTRDKNNYTVVQKTNLQDGNTTEMVLVE